jgi:hypothetical protein
MNYRLIKLPGEQIIIGNLRRYTIENDINSQPPTSSRCWTTAQAQFTT